MTAGTGARTLDAAAPESTPGRARRVLASGLRIALALALPWIVLEIGLRVAGYAPPDLRPRVALFPRFPAFYEPSRELGWVLKPNLDWRGAEVAIPFRTDASGNRMHGDTDSAGELAVDCIGDSSTFGFGVAEGDTYPALLQARLRAATDNPSLRVRNLGVPGYTAYEARILAARDGPRAPVTLVMMGFNDHFPTTRTRFTSLWMRRAAYACFRSRACALIFDRVTRPTAGAPPPPRIASSYVPDVSPAEYQDQLVRTVRALRAAGSAPILLVYPSIAMTDGLREQIADFWKQPLDQVDANLAAHAEYQQLTRQVASREGVRVVDLPPVFDAAGNVRLHFDWVHPNGEGQALIASTAARSVQDALSSAAARRSPSNP